METYTLKDYHIYHKKIGSGAFSTIHKAFKKDSTYAVKKISYNSNINNNYKKEFTLLRKLNHKNIIKLHDIIIDTNSEYIYLILDYYKNGDLSNFLKNRSLKEKYTKNYMFQLRDGLKYLIDHSVIHRDLKPQNILLTDDYILKITDFGLARYYNNDNMITTICGSPLYMAPEILKKKKYSIKSDLWSVGVILYQMLYGTLPYKAKNIISLINEIDTKNINYENNFNISSDGINLIKLLLEINQKKRIEWNSFFYHSWFNENILENEENKLLEISFNNLPNLNNFNQNESQFNSFKYKSIYPNKGSSKEEATENNSLEFNFHLNESNESNKLNNSISDNSNSYLSCESNNYNSDNDSNNHSDTDRNQDNINTEEYDPEEDYDQGEYNKFSNTENLYKVHDELNISKYSKTVSLPINIKNNNYVIVNKNVSLPNNKKSLSDSFKQYLSTSMYIVKQSYEYISNSN